MTNPTATLRRADKVGKGVNDTVLERIGNTPLVRIRNIGREFGGVEIYAKAEWFNPGGSIKDRAALRMVEDAEKDGRLTKGKTILDSTSGNTGIAYAMIGAIRGYEVELVVPGNISMERKKIISAYGAKLIFSSPLEGSDGALLLAHKIFKEEPEKYFMPCQYNNPSNWMAHYDTTGPEIWEQTGGRVTHLVAGLGTSGTAMGTGKRLKDHNPRIRVVGVQPAEPVHGIEGLKHMPTSIKPYIYDESLLDENLFIKTEEAWAMADRLASEEGLLVGHSSGAALAAALKVAAGIERGLIVVIFPDGGDRYLSLT